MNLKIVSAVVCVSIFIFVCLHFVHADASLRQLGGAAFSDNIGWISFDNSPVTVSESGDLNGYGWSDNVGWIKFGGLTGFPEQTYGTNAKLAADNTLSGWARAVSGMAPGETYTDTNTFTSTDNSSTGSSEKWIAFGYNHIIYLAKYPGTSYTAADGRSFVVYDPIRTTSNLVKFKADPQAAIKAAQTVPIGTKRTPRSRLIFNIAQFNSETPAVQKTMYDNFDYVLNNRLLCTTSEVKAKQCHVNNGGPIVPGIAYTEGGPIYSSVTDSAGGVAYRSAPVIGTYTVAGGSSSNTTTSQTVTVGNTFDSRGGWDGWLSLKGPKYGVKINSGNAKTPTYAWGSDVIGWTDWSLVTLVDAGNLCFTPETGYVEKGESAITVTHLTGADEGKCQNQPSVCEAPTFVPQGAPGAPYSCVINVDCEARDGITLKNTESHKFFSKRVTADACVEETITCENGKFIGTDGLEDTDHVYDKCLSIPGYKEIN